MVIHPSNCPDSNSTQLQLCYPPTEKPFIALYDLQNWRNYLAWHPRSLPQLSLLNYSLLLLGPPNPLSLPLPRLFSESLPGNTLLFYQRLSQMPHPPWNFSCSSPFEHSEHIVFLFWHFSYYALCYDNIFTFNWTITSHFRHSNIWCVERTPLQKIKLMERQTSCLEMVQSTRMQSFWKVTLLSRSKNDEWALWTGMAIPQKIRHRINTVCLTQQFHFWVYVHQ